MWHSQNHWSSEETMLLYIEKIIILYLNGKRAALKRDKTHPALAIFGCFCGQTTPTFYKLLENKLLEHRNISYVHVPANCTNKLQALDVSVNKPMKYELKKWFQSWYMYAGEVTKQLKTTVALKVAPREDSLANVLSPIALRERSLENVLSPVALREHSLANVLSRTFSRERSLANVLSPVALCEHSLANVLSIAESFSSVPLQNMRT